MARYPLFPRVEDPRRMAAETLGQIRSDVNSDRLSSRSTDATLPLLVLDLQIFPGIGVAGGDGREDVLPFLRRYPRADRVDERVAEHGYHVIILEDPALDLLGQFLSLRGIDRPLVLVELAVEVRHADTVTRVEAAALEECLVPERPAPGDPGGLKDDLDPGPVFEPAL